MLMRIITEKKRHTWLKDIVVAKPASNVFLVACFALLAAVIVAYLFMGERTRQAPVSGYVVPEEGLIKVFTQQAGTISAIGVKEGQFVKQGTVLATVSFEHTLVQGPMRQQIDQGLAHRHASVGVQRRHTDENFTRQTGLVKERMSKIRNDLTTLDRSIASQQASLALLRGVVASDKKLAEEGYLGRIDYQQSALRLMDQENRLRELERQKLSLARELIDAQIEVQSLPARALETRSGLMREADDIAQQQIENEDRRENRIIAPVDGTVTAIQRPAGKYTTPEQPVLSLIPSGTTLLAQLYVTSEVIGFLREGSEARLQFAAFPYQKFGSHKGRVISVSRTAVPEDELPYPVLREPRGKREMVYIVKVKPEKDFVMAYDKKTLAAGYAGRCQDLDRPAHAHRVDL